MVQSDYLASCVYPSTSAAAGEGDASDGNDRLDSDMGMCIDICMDIGIGIAALGEEV